MASYFGRIPPVFIAVASQIIAFVVVFPTAAWIGRGTDTGLPIVGILLVQGVAAGLISRFAGLARWWIVFQIALPPAALAVYELHIPGWVYLLAFVLLTAVFWNTVSERVPLYLTNHETMLAIDKLLPTDRPFRFVDIGCGLASVLSPLARRHPDSEFVGVESAPLPYMLAAIRLWILGYKNARLVFGPMWAHSLTPYDVVYCFLSPAPMAAMFDKARREMPADGLFISNSFLVPGHQPDEIVEVGDGRRTKLLLWRLSRAEISPETATEAEPEAAAPTEPEPGPTGSD